MSQEKLAHKTSNIIQTMTNYKILLKGMCTNNGNIAFPPMVLILQMLYHFQSLGSLLDVWIGPIKLVDFSFCV